MWCMAVMAFVLTMCGRGCSASWRDEMVVLAPLFVILILVSSQTGFSVHSRYLIPALPFSFVWVSKVARAFEIRWEPRPRNQELAEPVSRPADRRQRMISAIAALAIVWLILSSLALYPHSLSYFNELAVVLPTRGDVTCPQPIGQGDENQGLSSRVRYALSAGARNGARHLLDSNIDWGQDLLYLKDWLDKHPAVELDGLAVSCSYPASLMGLPEALRPPAAPTEGAVDEKRCGDRSAPKPGWYALSVNYIYGRDRNYRYFLKLQPAAMAGYSIYIYHITLTEANRIRRGLGLGELPEK